MHLSYHIYEKKSCIYIIFCIYYINEHTLFKRVFFEGRRFLLVVSFNECIWADISKASDYTIIEDYMIRNEYAASDFLNICEENEVKFGFLWGSAASCSGAGPAV